jgi:hypothetical protein
MWFADYIRLEDGSWVMRTAARPEIAGYCAVEEDKPPERRPVERMREWAHDGKPDCARKNKPVFTPPNELPQPCGSTRNGYDFRGCGSGDWQSKGIVIRFRDGDKKIIRREP